MRRALLAAAFVLAQLLINFHHVSEAHVASEDSLVVECDICTVSPGVFDAPAKTAAPEMPEAERTVTPFSFNRALIEAHSHSSVPRAPPQNI